MAGPTISTWITPTTSSSVYGQPVTFIVQVDPVPPDTGTPTGKVTFTISGGPTVDAALNSTTRQASITISDLSVGVHTITATFVGNGGWTNSTAPGVTTHTVGIGSTTTSVINSPTTSVAGQATTFTALVTPVAPSMVTPTGAVTFTFTGPSTFSATGTVGSNGRASITTSSCPASTGSPRPTTGPPTTPVRPVPRSRTR